MIDAVSRLSKNAYNRTAFSHLVKKETREKKKIRTRAQRENEFEIINRH